MNALSEIKRREEAKREAAWTPLARWQALQATLTWVEGQASVRRNTPGGCLRAERRRLLRGGSFARL